MLITCIDLMKGKAVQLIGGKEKALERDNPLELARGFACFGEVAVVDLDAAMGERGDGVNGGVNEELIKEICGIARCRVGGGIATIERAVELVSYGAEKIIIGSKAFEGNRLNVRFLRELADVVGKERVMVAVDAREGEIVVNGWRDGTGLDLLETAKQLRPYAWGLLFTCVEREGRMEGIDMRLVERLRGVFDGSLTVAGGVGTLEEIETLGRMGVDVQVGMAVYTGKIDVVEAFVFSLNWKTPLLPVITVDMSGQVLMMAYMDREALRETLKSGKMCYYSRSRGELWRKGETSGNEQVLVRMRVDCDRDALLAEVSQVGVACHLGSYSCFGERRFGLEELYGVVGERFLRPKAGSYTATLDDVKVREKLLEEAQEVAEAESREEKIWEAADLLYFLTVLLQKEGIAFGDVFHELRRRRYKPTAPKKQFESKLQA